VTGVKAKATRGGVPAVGLLAFSVVVWGCTPRVTAVAAPFSHPLTLTMLRAAPAALVLLAALPFLRARLPRSRPEWVWTAVTGLLMVTVFLGGLTEGVIKAGPGNAIVLVSTAPFFVVVCGRVFLGQRASLHTVGGLVVGFIGVTLIVSSQLGSGSGAGTLAVGMVLALAAALAWAAGTLMIKELVVRRPSVDLVGVTAGQYVIGGLALVALSFAVEGTGGAKWASGTLWWAVAFLAVVGSALATVTYFGALRKISATEVTAWTFLSPVVAVALEIVLGHAPTLIVLVGMALTIAGVAIVTASPRPRGRSLDLASAQSE
jgi:probable blue pigment (indigoidine) exporter